MDEMHVLENVRTRINVAEMSKGRLNKDFEQSEHN